MKVGDSHLVNIEYARCGEAHEVITLWKAIKMVHHAADQKLLSMVALACAQVGVPALTVGIEIDTIATSNKQRGIT